MTFNAHKDDIQARFAFKLKKILEIKIVEVIPINVYLKNTKTLSEVFENAAGIIFGVPLREYIDLKVAKPHVYC